MIHSLAHNGKSNLMLNQACRNKRQEEENKRENEAARHLAIIGSLKEEVANLKDEPLIIQSIKNEADKHANMLQKIYEQNVIDENMNPLDE